MLGLKVDSMLEQCVLPIVHKYTDNNKWKILKVLKLNPLANMEEDWEAGVQYKTRWVEDSAEEIRRVCGMVIRDT